MTNTARQWRALSACIGQHRRSVARSKCLHWPTPQAFDGNRVSKWNDVPSTWGKAWKSGDVLGQGHALPVCGLWLLSLFRTLQFSVGTLYLAVMANTAGLVARSN